MVNTILSVFTINPSYDTVCPLELGLEDSGGVVLYGAELKEPHTELLLSSLFCPSLAAGQSVDILTQGSRAGPGSLQVTDCRTG